MNKKFNKIPAIILMIWPYLFSLMTLLPEEYYDDSLSQLPQIIIAIYIFLTFVVYITNIVYAISFTLLHRNEDICKQLAFWGMLIKLTHIPFFLVMLALGILCAVIAVVPVFIFVSPILIAVIIIIDALLMITTSTYGICALVQASKNKVLTLKTAVIQGILHYIFVLDTISSIYVFVKIRKHFKTANNKDFNTANETDFNTLT